MKRVIVVILAIGLMPYAPDFFPMFGFKIAENIVLGAEEGAAKGPMEKRKMPEASEDHAKANAAAVEHHDLIKEAVQEAAEAKLAAREALEEDLKAAQTDEERKAAVDKLKESVHLAQEVMHEKIEAAKITPDHPEEPEHPEGAAAEHVQKELDITVKSAGDEALKSVSEAAATLAQTAKDADGDHEAIHTAVAALKAEVLIKREAIVTEVRKANIASMPPVDRETIKALVLGAKSEIRDAKTAVKGALAGALSAEDRRLAVEVFRGSVSATLEKLRMELRGLLAK